MESLRAIWARAQHGDTAAMQQIADTFDPLLQKYGRKLSHEDGKSDLLVFLLTLVKATDPAKFSCDGQLVAYLHKSVVRQYIRLSRKRWRIAQIQQPLYAERLDQACPDFSPQCDNILLLRHCLQRLEAKEQRVLFQHYFLGETMAGPKLPSKNSSASMRHIHSVVMGQFFRPQLNCVA